jgi:hypothetical protein
LSEYYCTDAQEAYDTGLDDSERGRPLFGGWREHVHPSVLSHYDRGHREGLRRRASYLSPPFYSGPNYPSKS